MQRQYLLPILTLAAGLAAFAQLPAPPADFETKADALVRNYVDDGRFQGVVLVKSKDTVLFKRSYGRANLEWGTSFSDRTRFRIASMTKTITAAAVLLLEEKGLLSLSDPINRHYPEAPREWESITIEHLLRHTSGIANYNASNTYDYRQPMTPQALVASVHSKPLAFAPGANFLYSNTGYTLAALIVERVGKTSFEDFVTTNILNRIGLEDTGFDKTERISRERASGYSGDSIRPRNTDFLDMSQTFGGWSMYSTPDDFRRFVEALDGGRLVSQATFRRMIDGGRFGYGLGVVTGKEGASPWYGHDGGIPGFSTLCLRFPDDQLTVVVFANIWAGASNDILNELMGVYLGAPAAPAPARRSANWEANELRAAAGLYKAPNGDTVRLTFEDDGLIASDSNRPTALVVPLYPETTDRLYGRLLPIRVQVVREGGIVKRIHYQHEGPEVTLERVDDTPSSRVAAKDPIPMERLERGRRFSLR